MKNYRLFTGLVVGCGLCLMQSPSSAQKILSAAQLDTIVIPNLETCGAISGKTSVLDKTSINDKTTTKGITTSRVDTTNINPARVIPARNTRAFPTDRVTKTLNGVWRGEVIGDAGEVHVDYFWIIDTKKSEALIIAQRSGKETVDAPPLAPDAPKLSYLMCAHDGYSPGSNTPQIHQFVKVSGSTEDAAKIVEKATGVQSKLVRPGLSDLWRQLVSTGYFDGLPYVAFAGGFFHDMKIGPVASADGGAPQLSMKWDAEYRGGGTTKLKYTTGVPMIGSEQVQFVGTSAKSGDFLVASPGNGRLWKVEVVAGGDYDLAFDQVSLGPLNE